MDDGHRNESQDRAPTQLVVDTCDNATVFQGREAGQTDDFQSPLKTPSNHKASARFTKQKFGKKPPQNPLKLMLHHAKTWGDLGTGEEFALRCNSLSSTEMWNTVQLVAIGNV